MTTQEAYEGIRRHFSRRYVLFGAGPSPKGLGTVCLYRGDGDPANDTRCAVGCLIPNDLYDPAMESVGVLDLIDNFGVLQGYFYGVDTGFLRAAQTLHDRYGIAAVRDNLNRYSQTYEILRGAFIRELDGLAVANGLSIPDTGDWHRR